MTRRGKVKRHLTILFTCIGRRVSLMRSFRRAAQGIGVRLRVLGTDASPLSPAMELCDGRFRVHPVKHPAYLSELLRIVRTNGVDLLVPTVDLDLKILARNRGRFEQLGCLVLVSKPEVIEVCQDKRRTAELLAANGFSGPRTVGLAEALRQRRMTWPRFLKPWDGSASRGNAVVHNRRELEFFGPRIPNCIVQEFVRGTEYTCDVFVDFEGRVRCVVPRRRLEVRGGEVVKAQVVKDLRVMRQAAALVTVLGAGPGVITIQLIETAAGKIEFIEINPRFGGGAPLSIKAGADFPKWILQQLVGLKPRIRFDGFTDGLLMLRYDDEVWVRNMGAIRRP